MRLLFTLVLFAASAVAHATTMTFEGVVADSDTVYDVLPYAESGYELVENFDRCPYIQAPGTGLYEDCLTPSESTAFIGAIGPEPISGSGTANTNGSAVFGFATGDYGPELWVEFSRTDGESFSLNSMDFGALDSGSGSFGVYGYSGEYLDGADVSTTLAFGSDWSAYSFGVEWKNLDYVLINYYGDNLAIDNISASVVPVPAAVWLFGSALAGLGWMRRKQTV
jgi:hypothetical protein